ncbi:MAG: thioesterase [Ruminococcaceae bacterium]|nr:thioesterase [Oscillospiraceae bacterium]
MNIGSTYEKTVTVDSSRLASTMKSGTLDVFATPALVAALEETSMDSIAADLGEGITTVGTRIEVDHLAASAPGAVIRCVATLVEQEGRRYVFELEAYDGDELIGRGKHERFAVKIDRFLAKLEAKKQS